MKLSDLESELAEATFAFPNPHGGERRHRPQRIIVHAMGEYIVSSHDDTPVLSAKDFLLEYGLSAHALITPAGEVQKLRDDDHLAWHAKGHNTGSLGIEVLVSGTHDFASFLQAINQPHWYTECAFERAVQLAAFWCAAHNLSPVRDIYTHEELDPSRKHDPGDGFSILQYKDAVADLLTELSY